MSEQFPLKKAYQAPIVMGLGKLARGSGVCENGSSPSQEPIDCTAGPSATQDCTAGGAAARACTAGNSAVVGCSAGDLDTTGGCTGGSTPGV